MNKTIEIIGCASDLTLMMFAGFVHYPLMAKQSAIWNKNLFYMLALFSWITITEGIFSIINTNRYDCNSCIIAFVLFWVGIFITLPIIYKHHLLTSSWSDDVYTALCQLNLMRILVWGCRLVLLVVNIKDC